MRRGYQFRGVATATAAVQNVVRRSCALLGRIDRWLEADALREKLESGIYRRMLALTGESPPSENKYVTLSEERDRFGDAFAQVPHELHELDFATFEFMSALHDRIVEATDATESNASPDPRLYASGAHHMGGTRMGVDPAQSVVDPWGRAHGVPGVYVAGGSTFPGSSGAMNPTLTMVALAFRTSDRIAWPSSRKAPERPGLPAPLVVRHVHRTSRHARAHLRGLELERHGVGASVAGPSAL